MLGLLSLLFKLVYGPMDFCGFRSTSASITSDNNVQKSTRDSNASRPTSCPSVLVVAAQNCIASTTLQLTVSVLQEFHSLNRTAVVTMSSINNYSTYRFLRLRNPKRFDNKSRRVIKRFPIFLAQRFQWVPKWLPLAYMNGPGLRKVRQFLRDAFLPVTPAKPTATKANSLWGSGLAHAHRVCQQPGTTGYRKNCFYRACHSRSGSTV